MYWYKECHKPSLSSSLSLSFLYLNMENVQYCSHFPKLQMEPVLNMQQSIDCHHGVLIFLLLWKFILLYQWVPLFVYNYIQVYDSTCEFRSSLFHTFHGSFPALHGSFSSVIIMLKIQVAIGTNIKEKIRAASCITGGQRIQQLLPRIFTKRNCVHTTQKSLPYISREEGTVRSRNTMAGSRQCQLSAQALALTKTARDDHPSYVVNEAPEPPHTDEVYMQPG